jgi:hypothetical protein
LIFIPATIFHKETHGRDAQATALETAAEPALLQKSVIVAHH